MNKTEFHFSESDHDWIDKHEHSWYTQTEQELDKNQYHIILSQLLTGPACELVKSDLFLSPRRTGY